MTTKPWKDMSQNLEQMLQLWDARRSNFRAKFTELSEHLADGGSPKLPPPRRVSEPVKGCDFRFSRKHFISGAGSDSLPARPRNSRFG
jgi:hypothetical protein